MFEQAFEKLQKAMGKRGELKLKPEHLDILEAVFKLRKAKQNTVEKHERVKNQPHSTVTGRIENLLKYGFLQKEVGRDDLNYYYLTPIGLGSLVATKRVNMNQALSHFKDQPLSYFEVFARMQPNLKEWLQTQPPFFVDQLTDDLWMIYYIAKRSDLRKDTLKFILNPSKIEIEALNVKLQVLCANRIEFEGKGICVKQSQQCAYKPSEIAKCQILNRQIHEELERQT